MKPPRHFPKRGFEFGVSGSGLKLSGLEFKLKRLGFGVEASKVWGLRFRVRG